MGRREFYAWVEQMKRELDGQSTTPGSWAGADQDDFFTNARQAQYERIRV